MSEDISETDDRLRFDDLTRKNLLLKLKQALQQAHSNDHFYDVEFEVSVMLKILEGFANGILLYQKIQPECQQRRRERIKSLAVNIEAAIEQLKQLDTGALGFVAWRGFEEISKAKGMLNEFPNGMEAVYKADNFLFENISKMTNFSLGIRKAADELPPHPMNTSGKDFPNWAAPIQLSTALSIERLFWVQKLKFTLSNSGLAAECLRATYQLAGLKIDRVDYWLTQARDHFDSMASADARSHIRNRKEK